MEIPRPVLKPAFDITRASHIVHRVKDLARSKAFYADALGFLVSDEDRDTVWLRGLEEACHHSIVLKRADAPGCERVGFRVFTDEDLELTAAFFRDAGLPARFVEVPFQSRTLHVEDVAGARYEFCASMETRPRAIAQFDLHRAAAPMRLDHFQILSPKVVEAWAFWSKAGFRTSEYIVDTENDRPRAVFMQRKGNPHDLVFMASPGPRVHHAAFTSPEAQHLMHACDVLARAGFGDGVEHGPGRHFGPGYARFLYLRDPDGHRIELFNNHYQTMDVEDEPVRWEGAAYGATTRWGRPPVDSWREQASAFVGD